jgi:hypothetical protein
LLHAGQVETRQLSQLYERAHPVDRYVMAAREVQTG